MPSFLSKLFNKKKHEEPPPPPLATSSPPSTRSPTPPVDASGLSTAPAPPERSPSLPSASVPPPPPPMVMGSTTNSSFAREDSGSSHLAGPTFAPGKAPPNRPGMKVMMVPPPPRVMPQGGPMYVSGQGGPMFMPPGGPMSAAGPMFVPAGMMHHHHHHHHHQMQFAPQGPVGMIHRSPTPQGDRAPSPVAVAPAVPTSFAPLAPPTAPTVSSTAPPTRELSQVEQAPVNTSQRGGDDVNAVSVPMPTPTIDKRTMSADAAVVVSDSDSDDIQFAEEAGNSSTEEWVEESPNLKKKGTTAHTTTAVPSIMVSSQPKPSEAAPTGSSSASPLRKGAEASFSPPTSVDRRAQTPVRDELSAVTKSSPKLALPPASPLVKEQSAFRDQCVDDNVAAAAAVAPVDRFDAVAPTSTIARQRLADSFLQILCPQQYFGRVHKISSIRTIKGSEEKRLRLKGNKITVVTKNGNDHVFYPLVRFGAEDVVAPSSSDDPTLETSFVLYDAVPGAMAFAETESEANKLFTTTGACSCYILSMSAILFKDCSVSVCPFATMSVSWIPHAADSTITQCPTHNVPLELFDTISKELVCALCSAKQQNPSNRKIIVLSELMSESASRQLFHSLSSRTVDTQRYLARQVANHQRTLVAAAKKHSAIDQQFDLLVAAINVKREEFKEAATAEYTSLAASVAKDILMIDEHLHIMKAASEHIRTCDSLKPLQMGTVAHALQVADNTAAMLQGSTANRPFHLPNATQVNLEGLMAQVQRLPLSCEGLFNNETNATFTSPNRSRSPFSLSKSEAKRGTAITPKRSGAALRSRAIDSNAKKTPSRDSSAHKLAPRKKNDGLAVAEPGSNGTSIFNCALHELVTADGTVSWALRIDDPGDWVGVGVGVGGTIESWTSGQSSDLTHLWIVPSRAPRTLVLRLTVSNDIVKLTVHDKRGKQLDDGRIAHWNASRNAFPQVSFGGRSGKVVMLQAPQRQF